MVWLESGIQNRGIVFAISIRTLDPTTMTGAVYWKYLVDGMDLEKMGRHIYSMTNMQNMLI